MIYEYEAAVLMHVNHAIPDIKLATYAKGVDMFGSLSPVQKLPSFYYSRDTDNWTFPPMWRVLDTDHESYGGFVQVNQKYTGRIFVANAIDAFKLAHDLRVYWSSHSYVNVKWPNGPLKVALRLLYIRPDEERPLSDKKGPIRYLEFAWSSQLFIDEVEDDNTAELVKEVHLHLTEDGVEVIGDNNLIKVIK